MKRAIVIAFALVACDQGAKKSAGTGSATAGKAVPAGPYVVHFDCFHSDQPFGPGNQVRNASWDLGAKTMSVVAYEYNSDAPPAADAVHAPVVTPLPPDKVTQIETAVVAVLKGGPYKPEYPVPEGTPCTLRITAGGTEVMKLEKADVQQDDAATDLVKSLNAP